SAATSTAVFWDLPILPLRQPRPPPSAPVLHLLDALTLTHLQFRRTGGESNPAPSATRIRVPAGAYTAFLIAGTVPAISCSRSYWRGCPAPHTASLFPP